MKIASELSKLMKEEEKERGFHIFANRHRREIFKELTRAPCQTSSFLARTLGYDVQTVEWHLKKLMDFDLVSFKKMQKKLFYPVDLVREVDIPLFSLLNSKSGWIVVKSLMERCRDVPFLYRHVSRSTAYRIIKNLKNLGFIREMKGTKRLICLNDEFYNKIEEYDVLGMDFKQKFFEKIEMRGYNVEIIGSYDYQLILRVRGIENFNLGIYISPIRTILEGRK